MSNIVKVGIEYSPKQSNQQQKMFLSLPRNLPSLRKRKVKRNEPKIIPFPRMQKKLKKMTEDQLLTRLRHSDSVDMDKVMIAAKKLKKIKVNHANSKIIDWGHNDALRFEQ